MALRRSQLEMLRHLDALEGSATASELMARLGGRVLRNVEDKLERLIMRGLVSYRYSGPSWDSRALYSLTSAGRAALAGDDNV